MVERTLTPEPRTLTSEPRILTSELLEVILGLFAATAASSWADTPLLFGANLPPKRTVEVITGLESLMARAPELDPETDDLLTPSLSATGLASSLSRLAPRGLGSVLEETSLLSSTCEDGEEEEVVEALTLTVGLRVATFLCDEAPTFTTVRESWPGEEEEETEWDVAPAAG